MTKKEWGLSDAGRRIALDRARELTQDLGESHVLFAAQVHECRRVLAELTELLEDPDCLQREYEITA